jgi:hypothetical protein
MTVSRCLFHIIFLASGVLACSRGQGEIISDNLAESTSGYQVLNDAAPTGNLKFAQAFNTTANSTITSVSVNLSMTAANSSLDIYDDDGNKPGSFVDTVASGVHSLALVTDNNVFSGLSISLAPSTKYWLVISGSTGFWGYNNANGGLGAGYLPNNTFQTVNDPTWHTTVNTAPYRLQIQAVPEPSGLVISAGLVLFAAWAITRRPSGSPGLHSLLSGAFIRTESVAISARK